MRNWLFLHEVFFDFVKIVLNYLKVEQFYQKCYRFLSKFEVILFLGAIHK